MNIGIIGTGGIAHVHMGAYQNIDDAKVVAVADIDLKKAQAFAETYKINGFYADSADLFETKNLDLVDICTPTTTHTEIVCAAAKSGKNILVEKPMARSTSECEKMIAEVEKHGSKLGVCHSQLFLPSMIKARSMVDSGQYNLSYLRTSLKANFELLCSRGWVQRWNISPKQGGILWEVGCHHAYVQQYFLQDVREVYAIGNRLKYPVHDEFAVLLRSSSQPYGVMEISWLAKETEVVYEIGSSDGKRAEIYTDFDYFFEREEKPPDTVLEALRGAYTDEKRILKKWLRFGANYFRNIKYIPHSLLISSYLESLKTDSPPPKGMRAEDGKNTIKLLECIEKSLVNKQSVKVD